MSCVRLLLALSVALYAGLSHASIILDQHNDTVLDSSINGGSSAYAWQQGVTAGVTGQLAGFEIFVREAPGETRLSVNLGAPWQSDASDWESLVPLVMGWNSFDLTSASIFLTAGDQFALGVNGLTASVFPPGVGISVSVRAEPS
jgi:hypothetical protein